MVVFCAGTLLAAVAPVFSVLIVARVVQAVGTAVMMPLLMTTLMSVVAERDRGRVMGNVTLAMSVAPALGPAVSGVVLGSLSWRWIFWLVLPIAAGIAVLGLRRLRDVGERGASPVDWVSVALAALGFGGVVYGLSEIGAPAGRAVAVATLVVGVLGVAAFLLRQVVLQREDRPLLDLRTFRHRVFAISLAAMSVAFMAMLGSMILLQLYLQNVRGMSPLTTGLLVMPGGLAMGLLGPRVGRVYDARGARVLVIPGALGLLASMVAFAFLGATTPTALILVVHVVLMVSLAACSPRCSRWGWAPCRRTCTPTAAPCSAPRSRSPAPPARRSWSPSCRAAPRAWSPTAPARSRPRSRACGGRSRSPRPCAWSSWPWWRCCRPGCPAAPQDPGTTTPPTSPTPAGRRCSTPSPPGSERGQPSADRQL